MARIGSKTNWIATDIPAPSDLNRIENNNAQAFTELDTEVAARIADVNAEEAARIAADNAEAALARNADNLTSGTVADARIASTIARDSEVTAAVAAEAALARNGDYITSGTVADARIASTIARDSEVSAAVAGVFASLTQIGGVGSIAMLTTVGVGALSPSSTVVSNGSNLFYAYASGGSTAYPVGAGGTWKVLGQTSIAAGTGADRTSLFYRVL